MGTAGEVAGEVWKPKRGAGPKLLVNTAFFYRKILPPEGPFLSLATSVFEAMAGGA